MLENIEISSSLKYDFKVMSSKENIYMKDLIINEANRILAPDSEHIVPITERENEYTSLIIDISPELKQQVRDYCDLNKIKIRDFWVECIQESMRRYNG